MMDARKLRKQMTSGVSDPIAAAAPRLPVWLLRSFGAIIGGVGPWTPGLRGQVRRNMRAADVDPRTALPAYFEHIGAHFVDALLLMRESDATAPGQLAPRVAARAKQRVELGESVFRWRDQIAGGGAILVSPHFNGYLLALAALGELAPLTFYLRYSKDARHQANKIRLTVGAGVEHISEPNVAGAPFGRLMTMIQAVERGRVLLITPDLPRKHGEGQPVRFADRTIFLPIGFAVLAQRLQCPTHLLQATRTGAGVRVDVAPLPAPADLDRRTHISQSLQAFADGLQTLVRESPALWYFWGDKRWTRTLSGDERYSQSAGD